MQKFGVMIMSGFAAIWFIWGLSAFGSVSDWTLAIPLVVSGLMIALAVRMNITASPEDRRRIGRLIGWASGLEGVAILVAVNVLVWAGLGAYTPCAVIAIVGLHFLPLAHALKYPGYYLTGAALVGVAVAGCAASSPQTRLALIGFGGATLLWLTCLPFLARNRVAI